MKMSPYNFKLLSETCVFSSKDRWSIIEADLIAPNGALTTWSYIQEVDYVVAVPVREDGCVFLKKEYRVSRNEVVLEVPSGRARDQTEVALLCEVNRELQEEVGLKAKNLKRLISFYPWNHASFRVHIYLATDLRPSRLKPDENEVIEVVVLPLNEALTEVIRNGPNAQTLLGLILARDYLSPGRYIV